MKYYNPTGYNVELKANRTDYKVPPFGEFEVYEQNKINVLTGIGGQSRAYVEHGVLPLNFDALAQKKFKTYKQYKASKCKEALMRLKVKYHEYYINEKQATLDINHNKGGEADKAMVNPEKFIKEEKKIQEWIDAIDKGTHPLFDEFKTESKISLSDLTLSDLSEEDIESLKRQLGIEVKNSPKNYTGKKRGRKPSNPALEIAKEISNGQAGDQGINQA